MRTVARRLANIFACEFCHTSLVSHRERVDYLLGLRFLGKFLVVLLVPALVLSELSPSTDGAASPTEQGGLSRADPLEVVRVIEANLPAVDSFARSFWVVVPIFLTLFITYEELYLGRLYRHTRPLLGSAVTLVAIAPLGVAVRNHVLAVAIFWLLLVYAGDLLQANFLPGSGSGETGSSLTHWRSARARDLALDLSSLGNKSRLRIAKKFPSECPQASDLLVAARLKEAADYIEEEIGSRHIESEEVRQEWLEATEPRKKDLPGKDGLVLAKNRIKALRRFYGV